MENSMFNLRSNRRGFTLPELLIVVMIIGTLATMAIPTFRRMMERSRQAEAKANLGNLFTVEAAFYTEYGVYGNNLAAMGFEVDGNNANMTYRFGFTSSPGSWACTQATVSPALGSASGPTIQNGSPDFYTSTSDPGYCNSFGRVTLAIGDDIVIPKVAADPYDSYVAEAAGVASGGINRDNPAGGVNDLDTWTIDNTRLLRNVRYGLK